MAAAAGLYLVAGSLYGYEGVEVVSLDFGLGKRALFLPDVHLHRRGERGYVIDLARRLSPDILILGGDLWDPRTRDFVVVEDFLEELGAYARYRVAVLGNHEYNADASGRIPLREAIDSVEELGYIVLRDDKVSLDGLVVAGVDWRSDPQLYGRAAREVGEADLLVSHSPDVFPHITARQSLVIAGHTHGGQVCIPGARPIITNSIYGYSWGLYKRGGSAMYVARGLGEMIPPRLFCRRQAVLLT
jgi:hypothetical protein